MDNLTARTKALSHLKDKMRDMEGLFEETEADLGNLTEEEKRSLKGLASAIEYHVSNLKN